MVPKRIKLSRYILPFILLFVGWGYSGAAADLPQSAYVSGVVGHAQRYLLSCESRSAADWAAFWGVNIDETEFLMSLPRSDNPEVGFVGNPNDVWGYVPPRSYGVHAGPVADLLREYGFEAQAQRDLEWDDLRAEIAAGRPVIVWVVGQMWPGNPLSYTASDGRTTRVASFEHTMILIGYDPGTVSVVDAYSGWTLTYPLGSFLLSWRTLGSMAVTGYLEERSHTQTSSEPGEGYFVQQGDYLAELARRFDTTWVELATLNGLSYPFTIYPGQLLQLPGSPENSEPSQENFTQAPVEMPPSPPEYNLDGFLVHLPLVYYIGAMTEEVVLDQDVETIPETYTVQVGEYLVELASRFELDWRELAELNGIFYPYVLYPGQELRLR